MWLVSEKGRLNSIIGAMAFESPGSAQQVMSAQLRADARQREAAVLAGVGQLGLPNGIASPQEARTSDHAGGLDLGQSVPETARTVAQSVPETARTVAQSVPETARTVAQSAPETARTVGQSVPETSRTVGQSVPETARTVGQSVPETARTVGQSVPETARTVGQSVLETARTVGQPVSETARVVGQGTQDGGHLGERSMSMVTTMHQALMLSPLQSPERPAVQESNPVGTWMFRLGEFFHILKGG